MKTPIVRTTTALFGALLACYAGFLFSQGASVGHTPELTTAGLVVAGIVGIYLIAIIVASERLLPTNRYTIGLVGIAMILFANLYLIDDPSTQVYLADIMKVIGVFLVVVGPMKRLVTAAHAEKKSQKNVEIIEV